jgi:hypothetical protein
MFFLGVVVHALLLLLFVITVVSVFANSINAAIILKTKMLTILIRHLPPDMLKASVKSF